MQFFVTPRFLEITFLARDSATKVYFNFPPPPHSVQPYLTTKYMQRIKDVGYVCNAYNALMNPLTFFVRLRHRVATHFPELDILPRIPVPLRRPRLLRPPLPVPPYFGLHLSL